MNAEAITKDIQTRVIVFLFVFCIIAGALLIIDGIRSNPDDEYKTENQRLKEENKTIQEHIIKMQDSVALINQRIDSVIQRGNELTEKYKGLKTDIKNLKPQYDKAASHSINYNADSIRRYFSKL